MNHNYPKVIASLLFPILGIGTLSAQPEFLHCSSVPDSLCVLDEGVRLPANNQLYLGEENPDATSCSVHVIRKKLVQSTCGGPLQYQVQLFLNDTLSAFILKPLTIIAADSSGTAELYFDTAESMDVQISTSGIPYTTGCLRYHRIKWIVTDSCGMESVCDELIDVYDCSIPVVEIPSSPFVAYIPNGCQITLYAVDYYLGGLDDCTTQDQLTFSFEEENFNPHITVECPEAFGVALPWKIWIADEGRDLNCDGQIDWTEKNRVTVPFQIIFTEPGNCDCGLFESMLSGEIITIDGNEGIDQVNVSLLRTGTFFPTYVTGPDGKYSFNLSLSNQETTIKPEKNDGHKNGVSTLDLIKIQKHLLGVELFNEPYLFIAADANNSQNVSAIDLIELRKLILGIYTELPFNMSWRFVAREYVFPDTMGTWTYASTITFTDMLPASADFYGIKIGDVNGSVQPHFTDVKPRESLAPFNLLTDQLEYKNGEVIQVPIRVSSNQALTGFQFTFNTTGMEILDVLPNRIPLVDGDFAFFGDKMTISWFDESTIDVSSDDVLFTLVLKATKSGTLSQSLSINSDITDAEIYLEGEQTFLPTLNVVNPISRNELEIMSCAPNPWKDETTLSFYLPETSIVTYNVIDLNGRKIYADSEFLKEGYHSYTLTASDISVRGMLFLEINSGRSKVVEKTVLLE